MWVVSQVFTVIFVAANLLVSIPVFSVIVRYNLVNAGIMPLWAANVVSIGTPWLLSLVFYAGNQLSELLNWSSALLFVIVNITLPIALYLRSPAGVADAATARAAAAVADSSKSGAAAASGGLDDGITPIYGRAPVSWSTFMPSGSGGGGGRGADLDTSMGSAATGACVSARWRRAPLPPSTPPPPRPPSTPGDIVAGLTDALLFSAPLPSGARSLQAGGGGGAPVVDHWDAHGPIADASGGSGSSSAYPPVAEDINPWPAAVRRVVSQHTCAVITLVASVAVGLAGLGLQGWQEWQNDTGNSGS
jgi:hypothetical protein